MTAFWMVCDVPPVTPIATVVAPAGPSRARLLSAHCWVAAGMYGRPARTPTVAVTDRLAAAVPKRTSSIGLPTTAELSAATAIPITRNCLPAPGTQNDAPAVAWVPAV